MRPYRIGVSAEILSIARIDHIHHIDLSVSVLVVLAIVHKAVGQLHSLGNGLGAILITCVVTEYILGVNPIL